MTKHMNANTILYILKDGTAIAFDYGYQVKNAAEVSAKVFNAKEILYKVTDNSDSWIFYRNAMQTLSGTHQERIEEAYSRLSYKVSDITLIPACTYIDQDGFTYEIGPHDGNYIRSKWLKRVKFDLDKVDIQVIDNDVRVQFQNPEDNVYNAFFSLNGMFYHFDVIDRATIIFRGVVEELTRINILGEGYTNLAVRVQAYKWEGMNIKESVRSFCRTGFYFTFHRSVSNNGLLFYNGLLYEYEVTPFDDRSVRLKNVSNSVIPEFDETGLILYEFEHEKPSEFKIEKNVSTGVANKYRQTVDFVLPVLDSLITYNEVDHEYEILGKHSILYPETLHSVQEVSNLSNVLAVNFMKG